MVATRMFVGGLLALLWPLSLTASASPAKLYIGEIVIPSATLSARYQTTPGGTVYGPFTFGENGNVPGVAVTLPDLSHGGSVSIGGAYLGTTESGVDYLGSRAEAPISGTFGFIVGLANKNGDGWASGPKLDVTGTVQGTLYGPTGVDEPMYGSLSGVATSVSLMSGKASDLPAPLLDILNNPGHLHLSGDVTGGKYDFLAMKLTFDPPGPVTVPEPTTLATLFAGVGWLAIRRRRSARANGKTGACR